MFKKTPEWFSSIFLSGAKVVQLMGKYTFQCGFLAKFGADRSLHEPVSQNSQPLSHQNLSNFQSLTA